MKNIVTFIVSLATTYAISTKANGATLGPSESTSSRANQPKLFHTTPLASVSTEDSNFVDQSITENNELKIFLNVSQKAMTLFSDVSNLQIKTARGFLEFSKQNPGLLDETTLKMATTLVSLQEKIVKREVMTDKFVLLTLHAYLYFSLFPKSFEIAKQQSLTFIEQVALAVYTSDDYKIINGNFRSVNPKPEILEFSKFIKRALNKMPAHTGVVKRGVRLSESELYQILHQDKISFNYFLSTTKALSFNKFENVHRLVIISKTGRDISKFTMNTKEEEVLFPPNTEFFIREIVYNAAIVPNGPVSEIQVTLEEI